jgi:hypothetical protein
LPPALIGKARRARVLHPNLDWPQPGRPHPVAAALYAFSAWLHTLYLAHVQARSIDCLALAKAVVRVVQLALGGRVTSARTPVQVDSAV